MTVPTADSLPPPARWRLPATAACRCSWTCSPSTPSRPMRATTRSAPNRWRNFARHACCAHSSTRSRASCCRPPAPTAIACWACCVPTACRCIPTSSARPTTRTPSKSTTTASACSACRAPRCSRPGPRPATASPACATTRPARPKPLPWKVPPRMSRPTCRCACPPPPSRPGATCRPAPRRPSSASAPASPSCASRASTASGKWRPPSTWPASRPTTCT